MSRPSVRSYDRRSDHYDSVLIYDGECPLCSTAATALRRVSGVGVISHFEEPARRFLEEQFDDVSFALVFVDGDEELVYVGSEAARELCGRAGLPALVSDLVGNNYESMADAIRSVAGLDREPAPYHDVVPLSTAAHDRAEELMAAAESTPVVIVENPG